MDLMKLEYRNAVTLANGDFDCEINHSKYGWSPFTASANDPEPHGRALHARISMARASRPYVPPTHEELLEKERSEMIATRYQFRTTLHRLGILAAFNTAVNNAPDPATKIAWEDKAYFTRMSPMIVTISDAAGIEASTLDDIFRNAMELEE